mmetsp:Transcript_12373/g.27566  ORF Transcript_12373/g.27566 Transcript_12373/m.27566 type:complete len:312 (+) Transcript_12373:3-938(+)
MRTRVLQAEQGRRTAEEEVSRLSSALESRDAELSQCASAKLSLENQVKAFQSEAASMQQRHSAAMSALQLRADRERREAAATQASLTAGLAAAQAKGTEDNRIIEQLRLSQDHLQRQQRDLDRRLGKVLEDHRREIGIREATFKSELHVATREAASAANHEARESKAALQQLEEELQRARATSTAITTSIEAERTLRQAAEDEAAEANRRSAAAISAARDAQRRAQEELWELRKEISNHTRSRAESELKRASAGKDLLFTTAEADKLRGRLESLETVHRGVVESLASAEAQVDSFKKHEIARRRKALSGSI